MKLTLKNLRAIPFCGREWDERRVYESIIVVKSLDKTEFKETRMRIIGVNRLEPKQIDGLWVYENSYEFVSEPVYIEWKAPSDDYLRMRMLSNGVLIYESLEYKFEVGAASFMQTIKLIEK